LEKEYLGNAIDFINFIEKQLATNQAKVGDYPRVCTKAIWNFISIIALILTYY
jgi:hypothetical protein